MNEKRNCQIVQDLLPNYIEKLTNEETNKYIEEHIDKCNNCKRVLNRMAKNLESNNINKNNKEVKYIKKFKNRMMILKAIILTIILILVIGTARKMYIISQLSDKADEQVTITNYHRITYSYNKGVYNKAEVWALGEKKKIITTSITDEGIETKTIFATKNKQSETYSVNTYIESEKEKKAILNKNIGISADPQNTLKTDNWLQLLIYSIPCNVKKSTFDGEECYYISNFQTPNNYANKGVYINKNTGLPISSIAYELESSDGTIGRWPTSEFVYEFNTVTEEDFIEPDLKEYEVIK